MADSNLDGYKKAQELTERWNKEAEELPKLNLTDDERRALVKQLRTTVSNAFYSTFKPCAKGESNLLFNGIPYCHKLGLNDENALTELYYLIVEKHINQLPLTVLLKNAHSVHLQKALYHNLNMYFKRTKNEKLVYIWLRANTFEPTCPTELTDFLDDVCRHYGYNLIDRGAKTYPTL